MDRITSSCSDLRASSKRATAANGMSTAPNGQMAQGVTDAPTTVGCMRHIAVIMDGNRRFGREKFSDALQGHWEGGKKLSDFTRWCIKRKIEVLTVYAFSTENWKRDPAEVSTLMRIFCKYADEMRRQAGEQGVRVRFLSTSPERLPPHVKEVVEQLEADTRHCTTLQLNVCVSYGGRGELVNACKSIAAAVAEGSLSVDSIDEAVLSRHMLTWPTPDPDLLIRTSGEYRISNFLLYQLAYSEMAFLDKYWPEVQEEDLEALLRDYQHRTRRYGS